MRFRHDRASLTGPELFLIEAAEFSLLNQEWIMKTLADVLAAITQVSADTDKLIAQGGGTGGAVDLQPAFDALGTLDAKIVAATTGGTAPVNTVGLGAVITLTPAPVQTPGLFATSDPTIATVDAQGNVTGVAPGTATITDTDANGVNQGTWIVTVVATPGPAPARAAFVAGGTAKAVKAPTAGIFGR